VKLVAVAVAVHVHVHAPFVHADGFVGEGSPRAIGRAGVGTVGDDGGGALLVNPAAIARRDTSRAQLAVAFIDDSLDWRGDGGGPLARGQGESSTLPLAAFETGVRCWVIGAAASTTAASSRALRAPSSLPPDQLANAFDYRYTGIVGAARRDTFTIGAARRLGDAVALGVSVAESRVALSEQRRIWAGFSGRDAIGDPAHDIELQIAASGWSPSAVIGVLVAPPDTSLELGASIGYAGLARVRGGVVTADSTAVMAQNFAATATLDLHQPLALRTGARWLGDRWIAEVDGDLWIYPASAVAPTWQIAGLRVVDTSTAVADVTALPSRASARTRGTVRAAVDVELVAGFLWATAGYAFASAGTDVARLSPTFGTLASHTAALGLEVTAGGYTITLGWSHAWAITRTPGTTLWALDNPFGAGDRAVPLGTYSGGTDIVGIGIDAELGGPLR
jgi:hypothetical protein